MFFPDWLIIWLAVAGLGAVILGARSAGLLLLVPAIIRFTVGPLLPAAPEGFTQLAIIAVVPLAVVFGAIRLLQGAVNTVYGREAAGYVAGNYLVRTFDRLGWILLALMVLAAFAVWVWHLL